MRPFPTISRRNVIWAAMGAALAVASFPYPALARVLAPGTNTVGVAAGAGGSDPGFWSGKVTAKTPTSLALTSAEGLRVVHVQPGMTLWKEVPVSIDSVAIGDWVMARGEPQLDGSLAARPGWAWVNIGQWHGQIVDVRSDGLLIRRQDGLDRAIHYSEHLEVIRAAKQVAVPRGTSNLVRGIQIGAVGLVLSDRSLRATRIWTSDNA